jgi:hypothetical protein
MIVMKKWKIYLSLIVISAILPAVLWAVISGKTTSLTSRASQGAEMRIWFEPANSQIISGKSVKIQIIASFDDPGKIIPYAKIKVSVPEQIWVDENTVEYTQPFSGRTSLGEINVTGNAPGKYVLNIADNDINTSLVNLDVITFPAIINVVPQE